MPKFKPKPKEKKQLMGRPTDYTKKLPRQAYELGLLGYSNKDMAAFFGVSEETFYRWIDIYPDFRESVKGGGIYADMKVARSFFKRATGFTQDEERVFNTKEGIVHEPVLAYYPPDVGAAKNWLANRQRKYWSERVEPDPADKAPNPLLNVTFNVNPVEAAQMYQKLIKGN